MRVVRLTERFNARRLALRLTEPAAAAVARTLGALGREELPGPADREAMMPPVAVYWFRRVPGWNLWIWFTFDAHTVTVMSLTNNPPIPLD